MTSPRLIPYLALDLKSLSAKHAMIIASVELLTSEEISQAANFLSKAAIVEDGLRTLLLAAIGNYSQPLYPNPHPARQVTGDTELEPSPLQKVFAQVSRASLDFLNADLSDEELVERGSVESDHSRDEHDFDVETEVDDGPGDIRSSKGNQISDP
ncbi:hypothetical protein CVT26_004826 [Gymnopilus dilepis]|uniref:Uncharacterized protein n=1 Tax=Gymnopilus dilepis TaxID=231916 RepID=A0A409XZP5_9AGAR|nr:hypothetical protein CVT26_004826 [Gymnopilus dilepis]